MRSDEEIERLIEDWLEDEARDMPHEILESALESIGRTPQVDARRRGPRWLSGGPVGILAAAAVLLLVVAAGALAVERIGSIFPPESSPRGPARIWDPAADWRSAPNQQNPSQDSYGNPGVWSYLRSTSSRHDPTAYVFMPNFALPEAYTQPGMTNLPTYLHEAWNEPAMINVFVALGGADGALSLHPTPGAHAILAWTSPVAGEVTIDATVSRPQDPCSEPGGDLYVSVDQGGETLRMIRLDHGQREDFSLRPKVGTGETLYFVVDSGTDALCDLTSLQLTITFE